MTSFFENSDSPSPINFFIHRLLSGVFTFNKQIEHSIYKQSLLEAINSNKNNEILLDNLNKFNKVYVISLKMIFFIR
jgi:hypothetical protein